MVYSSSITNDWSGSVYLWRVWEWIPASLLGNYSCMLACTSVHPMLRSTPGHRCSGSLLTSMPTSHVFTLPVFFCIFYTYTLIRQLSCKHPQLGGNFNLPMRHRVILISLHIRVSCPAIKPIFLASFVATIRVSWLLILSHRIVADMINEGGEMEYEADYHLIAGLRFDLIISVCHGILR